MINEEQFYKLALEKAPTITIKGEFINQSTKILVEDELGIYYMVRPYNLTMGWLPNSRTAVDKQDWFRKKANAIHNNKYNYDNSNFRVTTDKVIIVCPDHGEFTQTVAHHLEGSSCRACSMDKRDYNYLRSSTEEFITKARITHNDTYDYSKVEYTNSKDPINITCPTHGDFLQTPSSHLMGKGCLQCGRDNSGWTTSSWIKAAKRSKYFDGFKVYIILCYLDNEVFIKIGRTFRTVKNRFNNVGFPYEYDILHEFKGDASAMMTKELELHRLYKDYKYTPNLPFDGDTECFDETILGIYD